MTVADVGLTAGADPCAISPPVHPMGLGQRIPRESHNVTSLMRRVHTQDWVEGLMNRGRTPVFHMRLPPSSQLKARLTSPALPSRKVASRKFPVSENPLFLELANNARARKLRGLFAEKQRDLRCCDHFSDPEARAGS